MMHQRRRMRRSSQKSFGASQCRWFSVKRLAPLAGFSSSVCFVFFVCFYLTSCFLTQPKFKFRLTTLPPGFPAHSATDAASENEHAPLWEKRFTSFPVIPVTNHLPPFQIFAFRPIQNLCTPTEQLNILTPCLKPAAKTTASLPHIWNGTVTERSVPVVMSQRADFPAKSKECELVLCS